MHTIPNELEMNDSDIAFEKRVDPSKGVVSLRKRHRYETKTELQHTTMCKHAVNGRLRARRGWVSYFRAAYSFSD